MDLKSNLIMQDKVRRESHAWDVTSSFWGSFQRCWSIGVWFVISFNRKNCISDKFDLDFDPHLWLEMWPCLIWLLSKQVWRMLTLSFQVSTCTLTSAKIPSGIKKSRQKSYKQPKGLKITGLRWWWRSRVKEVREWMIKVLATRDMQVLSFNIQDRWRGLQIERVTGQLQQLGRVPGKKVNECCQQKLGGTRQFKGSPKTEKSLKMTEKVLDIVTTGQIGNLMTVIYQTEAGVYRHPS